MVTVELIRSIKKVEEVRFEQTFECLNVVGCSDELSDWESSVVISLLVLLIYWAVSLLLLTGDRWLELSEAKNNISRFPDESSSGVTATKVCNWQQCCFSCSPLRTKFEHRCRLHGCIGTASNRAGLRSAQSLSVAVPRTHLTLGDRTFSVAAPRAWNNLPPHIRHISSTDVVSKNLKSFLFSCAF